MCLKKNALLLNIEPQITKKKTKYETTEYASVFFFLHPGSSLHDPPQKEAESKKIILKINTKITN